MYTQRDIYMDGLERVEEIDPWNEIGPPVALKDGIDIHQLSHGGVNMEIDVEAIEAGNTEESKPSFMQKDVLKQLNFDCIDLGTDESSSPDSDDHLPPFERMAKGMKPVPGTGGEVLKKVIRGGVGPVVPEGATVRVHYNGYLEYSDEPYDSSRLRNRQQQFRLGQGEVIPGWDVGVATMRKSELCRFLVNPSYAFGDIGCPPRIPPGATILFEIEMVSFVNHKAADEFDGLTKEEKKEATLDQLIAVANAEREAGNDFFVQKIFGKASSKYLRAVRLLEPVRLKDEEEEKKWKEALLKLYLNQSLCSLRMTRSKLAITQCRKALDIQPKNVKANFRLGQAFMQLGEFKKSKDCLMKAGRLSPGNQEIRLELLKLDKAVTKFKALEKAMCTRMVQFSVPKEQEKSNKTDSMEKIREDFRRELIVMRDKPSMRHIVLPQVLSADQVSCAEEIAHELGLKTDKSPDSGLRIYKEDVPVESVYS